MLLQQISIKYVLFDKWVFLNRFEASIRIFEEDELNPANFANGIFGDAISAEITATKCDFWLYQKLFYFN